MSGISQCCLRRKP